MENDELRELQDPASWDFDRAEARPPAKRPRAVVSVAFSREDYDRVTELARRSNMRTSEYIRAAALGHVRSQPAVVRFSATSSGSGLLQGDFTSAANASFSVEDQPEDVPTRS